MNATRVVLSDPDAAGGRPGPVSYTHLDVYKRQIQNDADTFRACGAGRSRCSIGRREEEEEDSCDSRRESFRLVSQHVSPTVPS